MTKTNDTKSSDQQPETIGGLKTDTLTKLLELLVLRNIREEREAAEKKNQ